MRRGAASVSPVLDASQERVVSAVLAGGPSVVLGAPGSGKTTTVVEAVVARVADGTPAGEVLVLAPDRWAASSMRDRITARLDRTVVEPVARTAAAYAFSLIRADAAARGEPAPRLITGPEQDAILADILAGHAAGEGRDPGWPSWLRESLELRGFRHELRDLLMRAMERGLLPADLRDLARRYDRPAWAACAVVLQEYQQVTSLASAGAYDPAGIVDAAVYLLETDEELAQRERRRWSLVAVDDLHEAGEAVARLLDRLRPDGADLLVTGDPDVTTQGFRGASPDLMAHAPDRYRDRFGAPARLLALQRRWRTPRDLLPVMDRVASGIGVAGPGIQRRATPVHPGGELRVGIVGSDSQQAAWVARVLRHEYLNAGTPWSSMAVIVRTSAMASALRRSLSVAQVPTGTGDPSVPLRDEPAVRPLRLAMRGVLQPSSLTGQTALELLGGPLASADSLETRRVRRWLVGLPDRPEGASSPDLLAQILRERPELPQAPVAVRRLLDALRAAAAAAAVSGADAETVLWALWNATGLAERWRQEALRPGARRAERDRADRDLDAVMALFESAERFVDRNPGAAPVGFLDLIEAQEVPEDTLAAKAARRETVEVLTPQAAAGREWDVVVIAGLGEGVWPDTRLRGSLLGTGFLVDVLGGREVASVRAAREQVMADERRLLHVAVTRSRRLLAACAVSTEQEQPSEFFEMLHRAAGGSEQGPVRFERTRLPRPATLSGVVAELRRVLLAASSPERERREAAAELARLAAAGVPGADPQQWYGLAEISQEGPLWDEDEAVPVSPSSLETYQSCPLRWLLQRHGGQGAATTRQSVGVLVHDLADALPAGSAGELETARQERFDELGLPATWLGHREDERSGEMVRKLAGYVGSVERELVGTELEFSVRLGRARLRGRVDRLERDAEGRLVVVDLKTGTRQPTKDALASHPQLGAYQAAVEAGAFLAQTGTSRSGGAVLVQLGGSQRKAPQQFQPPLSAAEDPTWALRMVQEAAEGMAGQRFAAVRNEGCRHCPVRASCPLQAQGRQVP